MENIHYGHPDVCIHVFYMKNGFSKNSYAIFVCAYANEIMSNTLNSPFGDSNTLDSPFGDSYTLNSPSGDSYTLNSLSGESNTLNSLSTESNTLNSPSTESIS